MQKKYLNLALDAKCVVCQSADVEYDIIEIEDSPSQEATCNACDAKWIEIYSVTSIEITHDPKRNKAK